MLNTVTLSLCREMESMDDAMVKASGALGSILNCNFSFPKKLETRLLAVNKLLRKSRDGGEILKKSHSKVDNELLHKQSLTSLGKTCKKRDIVALKTIRLSMSVAAEMMKQDKNLFIIFLTRDPRGSALSRMKLWWMDVNEKDLVRRMGNICSNMKLDYDEYKLLLKIYPNRLVHIRYEDLAYKPVEHASAVYKMLGYDTLPQQVSTWIEENTHTTPEKSPTKPKKFHYSTTRNASAVVYAWKKTMKVKLQQQIGEACKPLMSLLHYPL